MLFAFLCSYIMYVCAIRFQEEAQISAVILHSDALILAMHRSCSLTEALLALISAHQRRVIWQNFWTAAKTSVYFSSRWVLKQPVLSGLECYTANLLPLSTLMELVFFVLLCLMLFLGTQQGRPASPAAFVRGHAVQTQEEIYARAVCDDTIWSHIPSSYQITDFFNSIFQNYDND